MFCENCGNKIQEGHKFCMKCGHSVDLNKEKINTTKQTPLMLKENWWHRLLKVLYIVGYIPLLIIIPIVWSENSCYYCSDGDSFWYSLLTLAIYVVVIRLIKLAVLYVAMGRHPEWKKEFKKLF